jgi:hypothetical protein
MFSNNLLRSAITCIVSILCLGFVGSFAPTKVHIQNDSSNEIIVIDKDGNEKKVPKKAHREVDIEIFPESGNIVAFKNPLKGHNTKRVKFKDATGKVNALWFIVLDRGVHPAGVHWFSPAKKKTGSSSVAVPADVEPIEPDPLCWCRDDNGFLVVGSVDVKPCCLKSGSFVCECETRVDRRAR